MSYWMPTKAINNKCITIAKHSLNLLKEKNYKVYFFCNSSAEKHFTSLPWTDVFVELDDIPFEYKNVWSLGKIFAYNLASKKFNNFLHLDFDIFAYNTLPQNILDETLVVHEYENYNIYKSYFKDMTTHCKYFPFDKNKIPKRFYSMAIFGGKSSFIKPYTEECIDFILKDENKYFFTAPKLNDTLRQALMGEQGYLGLYLNKNKIKPHIIGKFNDSYYHYGLHKSKIDIDNLTSEQILKLLKDTLKY